MHVNITDYFPSRRPRLLKMSRARLPSRCATSASSASTRARSLWPSSAASLASLAWTSDVSIMGHMLTCHQLTRARQCSIEVRLEGPPVWTEIRCSDDETIMAFTFLSIVVMSIGCIWNGLLLIFLFSLCRLANFEFVFNKIVKIVSVKKRSPVEPSCCFNMSV